MENLFAQYLPLGIAVISLLAFLVSLITEVIKNLGFMRKIPTNIVVLVLSVGLCLIAYLAYCSICECRIYWYSIIGSILGGFIVAYVATYGWEKLHALYLRFQKQKENENTKK
jgi:hypothetical protein